MVFICVWVLSCCFLLCFGCLFADFSFSYGFLLCSLDCTSNKLSFCLSLWNFRCALLCPNSFYRVWLMHAIAKPQLWYPLCSTYSSLPQPQPPGNYWYTLLSLVLYFPYCDVVGMIRHLVILDWLLSVSNMHMKFLLVFSDSITHLLF